MTKRGSQEGSLSRSWIKEEGSARGAGCAKEGGVQRNRIRLCRLTYTTKERTIETQHGGRPELKSGELTRKVAVSGGGVLKLAERKNPGIEGTEIRVER